MKLEKIISLEVFSRRSMRRPADYFSRLTLHHETMPGLRPMKWGWWEPQTKVWSVEDLSAFIPDDRGGAADRIGWKRSLKPKAEGGFGVSYTPRNASDLGVHSSEGMVSEFHLPTIDEQIAYIQKSTTMLDGDIAFVHFVAEQEKSIRKLETLYDGAFTNDKYLSYNTHMLRHWLPELPWAVVFGQAYVRLFGLDGLLSAPAYEVKKLSDEAVYLQLSPKITDLIDDYEAVDRVRQAVKDHIGRDAFFDVTKAYPLRRPLGECTGEQIRAFKPPPPIGTVFRVPDFQLIEDEVTRR